MTMPSKDEQVLQHIIRYCNQVEITIVKFEIVKSTFKTNFLFISRIASSLLSFAILLPYGLTLPMAKAR